jgi:outer membrane protein assembly factor BamB
VLACAVLVAACGGGDDSSTTADTTASTPGTATGTGDQVKDVDWPYFGRVEERTHYIAEAPDPPFHMLWEFFAKQLIEFPPVLQNGYVFVVNKTGDVFVVNVKTGKSEKSFNLGNDVTGPAYSDGVLYLAQTDGHLTALDPITGKTKWTFDSDAELESSPLVAEGTVYLGSDDGHFYAIDAATGKLKWRVGLGNDVKASPSIHDGVLYVGDYEGVVWALDASTGKTKWSTDTTTISPKGAGGFYSSPSIAFGNVYEARDDGTVYALDAGTGKFVWQFATSNSIYASPAAAEVPGTPPSVYVGSYNHQLYALDATNGHKRWRYDVGGVIPGTATVVGKTVYTSSFQTKRTLGIDVKTGKKVFEWGSAGFTPVISDGERVFLTGFQTVWAFDAKDAGEQEAQSVNEPGPTPQAPRANNNNGAG